ncbi:MAG: Mov34/MPN/PAD-1 family protein [Chloroflexota bacterium]|nr:Mov34/MPN/PAD-1 family protein [Chloroflexota bacterium]
MPDWLFRSADERFGLYIPQSEAENILERCCDAGIKETGGILFGSYAESLEWAHVSVASSAPPDSKQGTRWFYRGVRGLKVLIDNLWQKHEYYLGEWHYHPYSSAAPSLTDQRQMKTIAASKRYYCPEPILLIVGGDPMGVWGARAWVFPRGRQEIELSFADLQGGSR